MLELSGKLLIQTTHILYMGNSTNIWVATIVNKKVSIDNGHSFVCFIGLKLQQK